MKDFNMVDAHQYRQRFLVIVDELRAALGYALRDQDADADNGDELAMEMMYGNFDFAVIHAYRVKPEQVLIECTFGEIPDGRFPQIALRLLEMNSALAEIDGSVFCVDDDGKTLVYTLALDIESLSGQALLQKMTEIVWHGRRWMETRFMKEDSPISPANLDLVDLA